MMYLEQIHLWSGGGWDVGSFHFNNKIPLDIGKVYMFVAWFKQKITIIAQQNVLKNLNQQWRLERNQEFYNYKREEFR